MHYAKHWQSQWHPATADEAERADDSHTSQHDARRFGNAHPLASWTLVHRFRTI